MQKFTADVSLGVDPQTTEVCICLDVTQEQLRAVMKISPKQAVALGNLLINAGNKAQQRVTPATEGELNQLTKSN